MHRILLFFICVSNFLFVRADNFWRINKDGGITWDIQNGQSHKDHIELSGKKISVVFRYGINNEGNFVINKSLVWPMLRTIPNDTHGSLIRSYDWNPLDAITINGRALEAEKLKSISLKGILAVECTYNNGQIKLLREYFPSVDQPSLIETYNIVNVGNKDISIEIPKLYQCSYTNPLQGVDGSYCIENKVDGDGYFVLSPQDTLCFSASISARKEMDASITLNAVEEKVKRKKLVDFLMNNLILETPDAVIDRMFAFSKIRACESIYETKGGPMHGPGGETFYAAIWANDQAEYINPYFPFVGYDYGNQSALNSYKHFARFMNTEWKPIPSSIIAEGIDIWNGAGDRGDAAMIAYGASRYALARGDIQKAKSLWPLITWCLEYCHRKLNDGGVVASDSDELEGRFPSGNANLCTFSLYYDALISASYLAKELKEDNSVISSYRQQAKELRRNINNYFAAVVEGFDTYAYYEGNDVLRSWICIPLTVGINERANGTIQALFSERLWTENGLLTQAGSETFWDRSTLYALRGVYSVGETERATEYLHRYSETRLLGNHVPYAIEAWPEGNQRHLSAESGLYGRIITEGLFGIRPVGFKAFTLTPHLPQKWNQMALRHVRAFGADFDLVIQRQGAGKLQVIMTTSQGKKKVYSLKEGKSITINLK